MIETTPPSAKNLFMDTRLTMRTQAEKSDGGRTPGPMERGRGVPAVVAENRADMTSFLIRALSGVRSDLLDLFFAATATRENGHIRCFSATATRTPRRWRRRSAKC